MKKYLIALILSFTLGLLLESSMVAAKQTTMSTYYPSSSGAYTKVLLVNGAGGPDENACFCAQNSANSPGSKQVYVTPEKHSPGVVLILMPGLFLQIRTADTWKFAKVTVQWLLMWVLVLTVSVPCWLFYCTMPAPIITRL